MLAEAFCLARRALDGSELLSRVSGTRASGTCLARHFLGCGANGPLCKAGCCVRPGAAHRKYIDSVFVRELMLQYVSLVFYDYMESGDVC